MRHIPKNYKELSLYKEDMKRLYLKAYELLQKGWSQGTSARDIRGNVVTYCEDSATNFCSAGAIYRARYELFGRDDYIDNELMIRIQDFYQKRYNTNYSLSTFNDNHTYEEVMKLWKDFGIEMKYLR